MTADHKGVEMDRERFDAFARLFATTGSRRSALGTLLGAGLLGTGLEAEAKKDKKRKARAKRKRKDRNRTRIEQVPGNCCSGNNCTPGKGKNLFKCCYEDGDVSGKNFSGANLGQANFSGADASGANFRGANAGKACFVDTDLTNAKLNNSTNLGGAIFCRTTMPDGSENNSGCGAGTRCCPTCDDENPCDDGEVCCNGRCVAGDCCDNGEQSTCGEGNLCCDNSCVTGNCCAPADCAVQQCQRRTCDSNTCNYESIDGRPGPRCRNGRICCEGSCQTGDCCSSEQCENPTPVCDSDNTCVACTNNEQCGEDGACTCGTENSGLCQEDFFQGFEANTAGWSDVERVESGTDDITARTGDFFAKVVGNAGSFTRWGGYSNVFPDGGYTTETAIYIDLENAPDVDTRFDYSSAVSRPNCDHRRDFVFNGGVNLVGGEPTFCVSASNDGFGWPCNPGRTPVTLVESGWYLFRHEFNDVAGVLSVDLILLDPSGAVVGTWTLTDPTDIIGDTVGGNRYGWFVRNQFAFLAIDDTSRSS